MRLCAGLPTLHRFALQEDSALDSQVRPVVAIAQPHLAFLEGRLEADYQVRRLWEGQGPDDLSQIEAMVVAGEFPIDKVLVGRMPRLELIACFTTGYDGVDVPWAEARGVLVTHSPSVNHEDVADHAMGLAIGAWRQLNSGDRQLRAGAWRADSKTISRSLAGRRLGVVGLGDIGVAVARRCAPFGLEVAWWGPREKPQAPWPRLPDLIALARWSDILVVACRASEDTRRLIERSVIEAVGPHGLIVNVSRGSVIDEDELIRALQDGRLGQAALDVFETEPTPATRWEETPNTFLTPHHAGATDAAIGRMIASTVESLRRHFAGEPCVTRARP